MTMHVKDGGTWKEVTAPSVRDGGAWKDVKEGWVKDAGSWKQFFIAEQVVLTNRTVSNFKVGSTATAGIIFGSTGQLQTREGATVDNVSGEWLDPVGGGASYWIRATLTGGVTPTTNPGLGTWLELSSTREWRNDRTTDGNTTSEILFEIAATNGGSVLDSATITITADRSSL